MALHRNLPDYIAQQRAQRWSVLPIRDAADIRVGILGLDLFQVHRGC